MKHARLLSLPLFALSLTACGGTAEYDSLGQMHRALAAEGITCEESPQGEDPWEAHCRLTGGDLVEPDHTYLYSYSDSHDPVDSHGNTFEDRLADLEEKAEDCRYIRGENWAARLDEEVNAPVIMEILGGEPFVQGCETR